MIRPAPGPPPDRARKALPARRAADRPDDSPTARLAKARRFLEREMRVLDQAFTGNCRVHPGTLPAVHPHRPPNLT